MATIKPFKCLRPSEAKASTIAALPYDVYNRQEARAYVEKHPQSFLAIDRPETQFPEGQDIYAPEVYQKAAQMLQQWKVGGSFIKDEEECYYVYELTMNGHKQSGIVACASIDDYTNNVIKKHENTRADKEQDRIHHIDVCSAQTGPIFLAYRAHSEIRRVIALTKSDAERTKIYDFTTEDGVRHAVYKISDATEIQIIRKAFEGMDSIYIADGHHRAASAVRVGMKRRQEHPDYDGTEEFNYFLTVLFQDDELVIMDYNRVVKDLNGLTTGEFLKKMKQTFLVESISQGSILSRRVSGKPILKPEEVYPRAKGEFSMYLDETWYRCKVFDKDRSGDPVEGLDVAILQNKLLDPVLGIKDPKTDTRVDFVGGIRGLKELERRVETDCKVAFAMHPTSIQELFAVADAGRLMPPKSTWFEPKLRSGIFIHEIES